MKIDLSYFQQSEFFRPTLIENCHLSENSIINANDDSELIFADRDQFNTVSSILKGEDLSSIYEVDDLLVDLVSRGLIRDSKKNNLISWVTLCSELIREVNNELQSHYNKENIIFRIINRTATNDEVIEWIRRCFDYTKSAYYHISGVVQNPSLTPLELLFWKSFRSDEMYHWKIYQNFFQYVGLNIESEKRRPAHPRVQDYVDMLNFTGKTCKFAYGALLYLVEMSPSFSEIENDPQFAPLISHYGFPRETILPLWEHVKYNFNENHNLIWLSVLRSKANYDESEVKDILTIAKKHCHLSFLWNRI